MWHVTFCFTRYATKGPIVGVLVEAVNEAFLHWLIRHHIPFISIICHS